MKYIPLADYARQRGLKLVTLSTRIRRGHIPATCVKRVGRTVLIQDKVYDLPTGNLPGAKRSGGGRPRKIPDQTTGADGSK